MTIPASGTFGDGTNACHASLQCSHGPLHTVIPATYCIAVFETEVNINVEHRPTLRGRHHRRHHPRWARATIARRALDAYRLDGGNPMVDGCLRLDNRITYSASISARSATSMI